MSEATTSAPVSFNLWRDPWIRVIRRDGQISQLCIGACLAEAHELAGLHDSSPLVVAGTHRMLVAILQAIYAPESLDDIAGVLRAGMFDRQKLEVFASQYAERFELFHPTAPFLQTGDVPLDSKGEKSKSVAYLFPEMPSGTNRTLFHHATDAHHHYCPMCCARGMVTIPAFAMSGGSGYSPSINGDPPIYLFPASDTFFTSLVLSLCIPDYQPNASDPAKANNAFWNTNSIMQPKEIVSEVGYIESLCFPSRRIRLLPLQKERVCTLCGSLAQIGVQQMLYEMGYRRSKDAPVWDDPFVAFRSPTGKRATESGNVLPVRLSPGKALWREYVSLILVDRQEQFRPRIVRQAAQLYNLGILEEVQLIRFRCIGVYNPIGKATVYEWVDAALEVPATLLNDILGVELIDQALDRARQTDQIIGFTFDQHFRPKRMQGKPIDKKVVRFRTLRERMLATFWQQLADEFRRLTSDAADPVARDDAAITWARQVLSVGERTFYQAAEQIGDRADALRARVQAEHACRGRLRTKRKEWIGE